MSSIFDDIRTSFRQRENTLKQLILINVIVFVVLIVLRFILTITAGHDGFYQKLLHYISLPSDPVLVLFRPWTLFTYFFTHEGFLHIIFNMLNLYWFGTLVQEYLGKKKLLSLYILGGLAGAVLYLLFYNFIPFFADRGTAFMIGASASVLAVIVAAATLLPDYTFMLILLGPVRIKYIAAFLVLLSISGAVGDNAGGNIAHLGGALIGFLFIKQLQRGNDLGRPIYAVSSFFEQLFQKRPKMKVSYKNPSKTSNPVTKPTQDEIDLILDKISRSGYESLSKEEKQKLFRASQR